PFLLLFLLNFLHANVISTNPSNPFLSVLGFLHRLVAFCQRWHGEDTPSRQEMFLLYALLLLLVLTFLTVHLRTFLLYQSLSYLSQVTFALLLFQQLFSLDVPPVSKSLAQVQVNWSRLVKLMFYFANYL